jgi:hypothetical protein
MVASFKQIDLRRQTASEETHEERIESANKSKEGNYQAAAESTIKSGGRQSKPSLLSSPLRARVKV